MVPARVALCLLVLPGCALADGLSGSGLTVELLGFGTEPDGVGGDAEHVYFGEGDTGALRRISRAGGDPETISNGHSRPNRVEVTAERVFFLTGGGEIYAVAKAPGSTAALVASDVVAFETDATHLYYTTDADAQTQSTLVRQSLTDASDAQVIFRGAVDIDAVAPAGDRVYFAQRGDSILTSRLRVVPTAGGEATDLALESTTWPTLVATSDHLYYATSEEGVAFLRRLPAAGGEPETIYETRAGSQPNIRRPHVDGGRVYFWESGKVGCATDGRIGYVGLGGGAPTFIEEGIDCVSDLSVADGAVFWAVFRSGAVYAASP